MLSGVRPWPSTAVSSSTRGLVRRPGAEEFPQYLRGLRRRSRDAKSAPSPIQCPAKLQHRWPAPAAARRHWRNQAAYRRVDRLAGLSAGAFVAWLRRPAARDRHVRPACDRPIVSLSPSADFDGHCSRSRRGTRDATWALCMLMDIWQRASGRSGAGLLPARTQRCLEDLRHPDRHLVPFAARLDSMLQTSAVSARATPARGWRRRHDH